MQFTPQNRHILVGMLEEETRDIEGSKSSFILPDEVAIDGKTYHLVLDNYVLASL